MEISDQVRESEWNKLYDEVEDLKEAIQTARDTVKDASFEVFKQKVEPLDKLKLKLSRRLCGHLAKVTSFLWSHEGSLILSAAQDGKLILWEGLNGNKIHMTSLKTVWVNSCGISLDGSTVCSGGMDNMVSLYSVRNNSDQPMELAGHGGYISKCRFFNSHQILSSSGDCHSILWDATTGRAVTQFHGHTKDVTSFDINTQSTSCSPHFITSSIDGTCRLWDVRSKKCAQLMEAPVEDAEINDVVLFPQPEYGFICATEQGSCHFWDLRADQFIADYFDPDVQNPCTALCMSKSGRLLFVGHDDCVCRVYDVPLEEAVIHLYDHESRVSGLGLSADGQALATGSWDNKLFIYTAVARRV